MWQTSSWRRPFSTQRLWVCQRPYWKAVKLSGNFSNFDVHILASSLFSNCRKIIYTYMAYTIRQKQVLTYKIHIPIFIKEYRYMYIYIYTPTKYWIRNDGGTQREWVLMIKSLTRIFSIYSRCVLILNVFFFLGSISALVLRSWLDAQKTTRKTNKEKGKLCCELSYLQQILAIHRGFGKQICKKNKTYNVLQAQIKHVMFD